MHKDSHLTKEIDNYLSGELSPEHVAEFEKRIREEQEIQDELDLTKKVIEGIEGYAFKQMLKNIHQRHFGGQAAPDKE